MWLYIILAQFIICGVVVAFAWRARKRDDEREAARNALPPIDP